MKGVGFLSGLFLLADGLRRFFSGEGGFFAFFPYLLVGSACIYVAGYNKRITLSKRGFERETLFWGRGRKEFLPWEDMEEIILIPSSKGTGAVFPMKERGWRAFFPGVSEEEIRKAAAKFRPDLPVSVGYGRP